LTRFYSHIPTAFNYYKNVLLFLLRSLKWPCNVFVWMREKKLFLSEQKWKFFFDNWDFFLSEFAFPFVADTKIAKDAGFVYESLWIESNWVELSQIESTWVKLSQIESNWVELSRILMTWVKSKPFCKEWICESRFASHLTITIQIESEDSDLWIYNTKYCWIPKNDWKPLAISRIHEHNSNRVFRDLVFVIHDSNQIFWRPDLGSRFEINW
jgi:hypothetical protein